MKTSYIIVLTAVIGLAVLTSPARAQETDPQAHGGEQPLVESADVVLHVQGLACEMCALGLTKALKKLEAIDRVEVLLEKDQRALLALHDGKTVNEQDLREAVELAGFGTRSVEFPGEAEAGDAGSDGDRDAGSSP